MLVVRNSLRDAALGRSMLGQKGPSKMSCQIMFLGWFWANVDAPGTKLWFSHLNSCTQNHPNQLEKQQHFQSPKGPSPNPGPKLLQIKTFTFKIYKENNNWQFSFSSPYQFLGRNAWKGHPGSMLVSLLSHLNCCTQNHPNQLEKQQHFQSPKGPSPDPGPKLLQIKTFIFKIYKENNNWQFSFSSPSQFWDGMLEKAIQGPC